MYNLRLMQEQDLEKVMLIEQASFQDGWSEKLFLEELNNPLSYYTVLEKEDGILVAYGGIMNLGVEADITKVAVKKDFLRQGFGLFIVQKLLDVALKSGVQDVFLEVREDNFSAIALYKKAGFNECGKRIAYYRDKDAILMKREIYCE